jgi:hypothetical protein
MALVVGQTYNANENAVFGRNDAPNAAAGGGGVQGAGVFGLTFCPGAAGVFGSNNVATGVGVQGNGPEAGVSGFSDSGAGVRAHSDHADAIQSFAHDPNANAILAINLNDAKPAPAAGGPADGPPRGCGILAVTNVPRSAAAYCANNSAQGWGVYAIGHGDYGAVSAYGTKSAIVGRSDNGYPIFGSNSNGTFSAVFGKNLGGPGVIGYSATQDSAGVRGIADENGTGVEGLSGNGERAVGVYGECGEGGHAGVFAGDVYVTNGDLTADGTITGAAKHFRIDHPLDPANKYLVHASMESPEMVNVYSGQITTDANGAGMVRLPSYCEALNRDFRYQLTVIAVFAQAIVAAEIEDNRFTIRTDKPNVKVYWQVTGVRKDHYAKAHPLIVEQDKPDAERNLFLHPDLLGQPKEKSTWRRAKSELLRSHLDEKIK